MLGHIAKVGSTVPLVPSQCHARGSDVTSGVVRCQKELGHRTAQASLRDRDLCATSSRIRSYCGMGSVPRKLGHQGVA